MLSEHAQQCRVNFETRDVKLEIGGKCTFDLVFPTEVTSTIEEHIELKVVVDGTDLVLDGEDAGEGKWRLQFVPVVNGDHLVHIALGGEHIPGSPFRIHVQLLDRLLLAAEKSRLVLVSKDLKTYKAIEFHVTFPANPAKKQSMVLDQHSQSVELKKTVAKDGEEIVLKCVFVPQKVGRYTLIGRLDKYDVCNSPLDVTVEDACTQFAAETKVVFEEEKHYTRTAIRFRVEFPREASEALNIVVTDEGHRTVSFDGREVEEGVWECEVEAMDRPGKYKVDVNMAGVSVQGYNRELVIHDVCSVWAEQCKAEGKGLEGQCRAWVQCPFQLSFPPSMDDSVLSMSCMGPRNDVVVMDATPEDSGLWTCCFIPRYPGRHAISISCGSFPLPGFPLSVMVRDPVPMFLERVSAVAPPSITTWDKEASVLVTTPPLLPIDEVSCKLLCPSGRTLEGQRRKGVEEGQNLYLLQGWEAGPHTLSVTLSGVAIPGFPLSLEVEDMALKHAALCGVAEDGLVSGLNTCGYAASFILTFQCPEEHLNVSCKDPLNQNVLIDGSDGGQEGVWKVDYLPLLPGPHLVSISVDTAPIPGSPFKVDVLESIGGRGRLLVFFSSASGRQKAQRDLNQLQTIFVAKKLHETPNFTPFIPIDTCPKDTRDELFRIAGTKELPQVWINDKYVGGVDRVQQLEDDGELQPLLDRMMIDFHKPKSALEASVTHASQAYAHSDAAKALEDEDKDKAPEKTRRGSLAVVRRASVDKANTNNTPEDGKQSASPPKDNKDEKRDKNCSLM